MTSSYKFFIVFLFLTISMLLGACDSSGSGGKAEGGCDGVTIPSCSSTYLSQCPTCSGDGFCVAIDGDSSKSRCCGCGEPFSKVGSSSIPIQ